MNLNKNSYRASILGVLLTFGASVSLLAAAPSSAALPEDPTHGSIRVGDDTPVSQLVKHAKLSQAQAEDAATQHIPGKVVGTELDEENQFLVWHVKVLAKDGTAKELAVDAGNGEVLAVEPEDY